MNPSAYMNLTPNGMQHVLANGVGNTGPLLQQQSPQPAWVGLYNEQKKNEEAAVNYEKPSAVESQSEDVLTFNTKLCESLFTDELRMDFDDFKRMTLIDDYEILDNLYSYSGQFNNSKIAASTIISLYRNKYKDLFERYPSLSSYILFVVIVIIENSYTGFLNIFKNLKTENRLAIKPKTIRDSKFSLVYRKRKLDATDSSSLSGRDNETHDNANAEMSKRAKREHPLFSTKFYVKNHILFNVGELWKHLLPCEFAIFVVRLKKAPIKTYGQTQQTVSGIVVNFNVPILFTINKRTTKGNDYHNMEHAERLNDYMKSAFSKDMYAFNFSILKSQKIAKLIKTDSPESESNDKTAVLTAIDKHKYIMLDNMQFWNHAKLKDTVNNRSFCEIIYYMTSDTFKDYTETLPNTDVVDDDDSIVNDLLEYYQKHNPEYFEKLSNESEEMDESTTNNGVVDASSSGGSIVKKCDTVHDVYMSQTTKSLSATPSSLSSLSLPLVS